MRAKAVNWSRRLFGWDLVWGRERETVRYGYKLMFGPRFGVVIKALPEGSQASLNLAHVRLRERKE